MKLANGYGAVRQILSDFDNWSAELVWSRYLAYIDLGRKVRGDAFRVMSLKDFAASMPGAA